MGGVLAIVTWLEALALGADLADPVRAVVDEAEAMDLPSALLVQKAHEGRAKGVEADRVTLVLRELVADWRAAEQVLGDRASASDRAEIVPAAAAALRWGASPTDVVELAAAPSSVRALWAVSDLAFAGVPPDDAVRRVVEDAMDERMTEHPAGRPFVVGPGPVSLPLAVVARGSTESGRAGAGNANGHDQGHGGGNDGRKR